MWYYVYTPVEKLLGLPVYLASIGLHELQPRIYRPMGYEYDQFFYNASGSGRLELGGKSFELPEGGGFFVPAGVPHEYYPYGEKWDIRWVSAGGSALSGLYEQIGLSGGAFRMDEIASLDVILNRMHDELIRDRAHGAFAASGVVYEFIMQFARLAGLLPDSVDSIGDRDDTYSRHMTQMEDYIQYHYMHPICMDDLCALLSVTPQHVCRVFRSCTGMRPVEYITHVRIEAAKELLVRTSHTVSDIAGWCGMEDSSYFCRVFKREQKMTPTEYRLKMKLY